jgi:hypothetical protein
MAMQTRSASLSALAPLALAALASLLLGCAPKIGDHCTLNTDCGSSGSLVCDTSLPNGYCTQFNCTPDVCQNSAACVALETAPPGCPYDDYHAPSRTTRTFCLAQCHHDSDCRQSDSYSCQDPRQSPYGGAIIDDVQSQRVCLPNFSMTMSTQRDAEVGALPEGSVCSVSGPAIDGSLPFSQPETGSDASDGATEAPGADGTMDATDGAAAGSDGSVDSGGDVAGDSSADVAGDAGAADAPDGD